MSPDERMTADQTTARDQPAGQGSAPPVRHDGVAEVVSYVERGYGAFPGVAHANTPRFRAGSHPVWAPSSTGPAGLKCATFSASIVEQHWPAERGIIPCLVPPHGVVILDWDEKHRPGIVAWLFDTYPELIGNGLHFTRSDGAHTPARIPAGVKLPQSVNAELGIDTRIGMKGYVAAPPAPRYRVHERFKPVEELIDVPRSLLEVIMPKPAERSEPKPVRVSASPGTLRLRRYVWSAVQGEHDNVAAAGEGSRNHTLHKAAVKLGSLVGAGMLDEADAREALLAGARAATDPLPEWEARRTIDSGIRYGIAHPRQLEDGPS